MCAFFLSASLPFDHSINGIICRETGAHTAAQFDFQIVSRRIYGINCSVDLATFVCSIPFDLYVVHLLAVRLSFGFDFGVEFLLLRFRYFFSVLVEMSNMCSIPSVLFRKMK